MDIADNHRVNLYCSLLDVKPRILLTHFLKYMGIYVEEITKYTNYTPFQNALNIYLISDHYVNEVGNQLDLNNSDEKLYILLDGYTLPQAKNTIIYDSIQDEKFLKEIVVFIAYHLLQQASNLNIDFSFMLDFIPIYLQNKIYQTYHFNYSNITYNSNGKGLLTTQLKNTDIDIAYHYVNFENQIKKLNEAYIDRNSEINLKNVFYFYIEICAKIEKNVLYKQNNICLDEKELQQDIKKITSVLTFILNNSIAHILFAELNLCANNTKVTYNQYLDIHIQNTIPALYNTLVAQADIVNANPTQLLASINSLTKQMPDYFPFYFEATKIFFRKMQHYQLPETLMEMYQKFLKTIWQKKEEHLLSPDELIYVAIAYYHTYLYCYQYDPSIATEYQTALINLIKNEISNTTYFDLIWNHNEEDRKLYFPLIKERTEKKLKLILNRF